MRDLAELARQIRSARLAERRFMRLWRIEQVLIGPDVLDRLAEDMADAHREVESAAAGHDTDRNKPDDWYPQRHGWSINPNGGADGES